MIQSSKMYLRINNYTEIHSMRITNSGTNSGMLKARLIRFNPDRETAVATRKRIYLRATLRVARPSVLKAAASQPITRRRISFIP